jgi:Na+-driven multidrug efflux pump
MFYFFLGSIFIFRNTLQSMGKVKYPIISVIADLIIRSFAAIILSKSLDYQGIYYAGPLAWIAGAIIVFIGYYINVYNKNEKEIKKEYRKIYQKLKKTY